MYKKINNKSKKKRGNNKSQDLQPLIDVIKDYPIASVIAFAADVNQAITIDDIKKEMEINGEEKIASKYNLNSMFTKTNSRHSISFFDLDDEMSSGIYAHCPFHNDEHIGSFLITPSKNMWYCFTCGIGGDAIAFEEKFYGLSFVDAVWHLAYRLNIIDKKDYRVKEINANNFNRKNYARNQSYKRNQENEKASDEVIASVYWALQKACPLTEEHREHLLKERGLEEKDLDSYFSFPEEDPQDLIKRMSNIIIEGYCQKNFNKRFKKITVDEYKQLESSKGINNIEKEFKIVPGFFYNKNLDNMDYMRYQGIGMLCKDDFGKTCGIQVRNDGSYTGGPRYLWFSSASVINRSDVIGGASPGSPGGIIFPNDNKMNTADICITEGRFKAEQIAKQGNIAIYVSGVSTWTSIKEMILRVAKKYNKTNVYLMFDSDLLGNESVHNQLKNLSAFIAQQGLIPYVIIWSEKNGKGFDDLVLAHPRAYKKMIKSYSFRIFESEYQKAMDKCKYLKEKQDIQDMIESHFGLI